MRTIFACLLLCIGITSCATSRQQISDCEVMHVYPAIDEPPNFAKLVSSFKRGAPLQHQRLLNHAASKTERFLSNHDGEDVETAFYSTSLRVIAKACRPVQQSQDELEIAAVFVERMGGSIVNSAQLRGRSSQEINVILPSNQINITAKANLVVLASSCSVENHRRINEALTRVGLHCFNP